MTLSRQKTRQNDLNDVQLVDRLAATGMARHAAEYIQRMTAELGHYEFSSGLVEVWMHQPGVYTLVMVSEQPARRVVSDWEIEQTGPDEFTLTRVDSHQVQWHGHWYSDSDIKPAHTAKAKHGTFTRRALAVLIADAAAAMVDAWQDPEQ